MSIVDDIIAIAGRLFGLKRGPKIAKLPEPLPHSTVWVTRFGSGRGSTLEQAEADAQRRRSLPELP